MDSLTRILEYRRARFLNVEKNLEELIRQAWAQFDTQDKRTITSSDQRSTSGLRSRDCHGLGFAVHCARYTDGQGVGTIPTTPKSEVEVGERSPEPGENYLNSDLIALVRDNHVICMNCGRNAGSLRMYLQKLFRKASFHDATHQFELVRIGSPDKLAIIDAVGVKSIDLKVDISEAASAEVIDGEGGGGMWSTITRSVGEAFNAVTARDGSVQQLRNSEKGTVKVSINVPQGDLEVAKHGLNEFSEEVVQDHEADAFVVHLRNGATIRPDEVSVRKQVKLQAMANSVSVVGTWDEMEIYMRELEESGQLEA